MERVEKGEFRRDLYYRLNVLNLMIPPLREREDDYLQIAELIYQNVVPHCSAEEHAGFMEVMKSYSNYPWPGNVRELNNVVERICLLQKRGLQKSRILDALWAMTHREKSMEAAVPAPSAPETLEQVERSRIQAALVRNHGNITRTAKELHISRSTLYRKLSS